MRYFLSSAAEGSDEPIYEAVTTATCPKTLLWASVDRSYCVIEVADSDAADMISAGHKEVDVDSFTAEEQTAIDLIRSECGKSF